MRSAAELQGASGYANQSDDFADLIHLLDAELRLVTPTEREPAQRRAASGPPGGAGLAPASQECEPKCYQLTHDYLVHSIRQWLNRKQRESRGAARRLPSRIRPRSGLRTPSASCCRRGPSSSGCDC